MKWKNLMTKTSYSKEDKPKIKNSKYPSQGLEKELLENLNQTANLLSRGKSEISWRRIKENQIQGFFG